MELDYKAIGIRIKRFRKSLGYTQHVLAEKSNQEPSNISHIERGATKLSLPTIVNISNALGVTVDDLICDSINVAKQPYIDITNDLLSDCTHDEMIIITETIISLKETLRKLSTKKNTNQ